MIGILDLPPAAVLRQTYQEQAFKVLKAEMYKSAEEGRSCCSIYFYTERSRDEMYDKLKDTLLALGYTCNKGKLQFIQIPGKEFFIRIDW